MEIFRSISNVIKKNFDIIIVLIIEFLIFIVFYTIIIKGFVNSLMINLTIVYLLARLVDIIGLKYFNETVKIKKNKIWFGIYSFFHILIISFGLLSIMVTIILYEGTTGTNIFSKTKQNLFILSIVYSSIYYFSNNVIIKLHQGDYFKYNAIIAKFSSILLGNFYIIYTALSDDKSLPVLLLGPVLVGTIIVIFTELQELRRV